MSTSLQVAHVIPMYLDPGSGSLLFQAAVGAAMATSLAVKVYWRRIKGVFRRGESDRDEFRTPVTHD